MDILTELFGDSEEEYEGSGDENDTDEYNETYFESDYTEEEKRFQLKAKFLYFRLYILASSLVIVIIVMMMARRTSCCLKCLGGHFALIIPVNFIENKRDRITILSAFAITCLDVLEIILENTEVVKGLHGFIKIFIRIALVLMSCFLCLPFLMCFSANTYVSLILGILYILEYMIVLTIYEVAYEAESEELKESYFTLDKYVAIYSNEFITLIFGCLLLFGYTRRIYKKIRGLDRENPTYYKYQKEYLKTLLSTRCRVQELTEPKRMEKINNCFEKHVYVKVPGFRYSLSLLISIIVGLVTLTHLFSQLLAKFIEWFNFLDDILSTMDDLKGYKMPNIVESLAKIYFTNISLKIDLTVFDFIREQLRIVFGSMMAAVITAYLLTCLTSLHMMKSYRENVISLVGRREEEHLLNIKHISNVSIVVSAIQYSGYQVAYLLWGAYLQFIALCAAYVVLCELFILPFKYAFTSALLEFLDKISPIIVIMILTKGIQHILVRFFFLQEKGALLALDNRKAFYTMMYFMYFYNIFLGIFSCLMRIIKAIIFGLWFLPRLDRSIFPRTFEKFDSGFKAYTFLLRLEAIQCNFIVVTFVNSLLSSLHRRDNINHLEISDDFVEKKVGDVSRRRKLAKNRWFVAYTLIRNPVLIERRHPNPLFEPLYTEEFESSV